MRIGQGYDVHRLVEGRRLILGGVEIPYEKGLLGHSDADVLLHALMDALLGAAALGDIGQHFPDKDPQYEGADSMELLGRVCALLRQKGYRVGNCDCTVIAQRPKLAPYIPARYSDGSGQRESYHGGRARLHRRRSGHRRPGDRSAAGKRRLRVHNK